MNLVGKIFVFLIFCMSIAFMSLAVVVYAAHTNWMEEVLRPKEKVVGNLELGLKFQLQNEKDKTTKLDGEKLELEKKLEAEKAVRRQAVAKLESEKVALVAQQQAALKSYNDLLAVHQTALDKVQTEQKRLITLRSEVDKLREENRLARDVIDERFNEARDVSERLHAAERELVRAEERRATLVEQARKYEVVLRDHNLTINSQVAAAKSIVVDGLVTAVKRSGEEIYVQLSIGSDDGLQIGFPLEVFRGSTYVGQVVVIRTTPDKSVARVDRTKQKAPVEPRDRVESRSSLKLTAG